MAYKNVIIGALLITLFATAMLTFMSDTAREHDQDPNDFIHESVDMDSFTANISEITDDAQDSRDSLFADIPIIGEVSILFKSIFGIAGTFFNGVISLYNLLVGLLTNILHIPAVVTNTLTAIIFISLVFGAWKLYRTGE